MEGHLRVLRTDDYKPSYDVSSLDVYDLERLSIIKLEIESELHILAKRLEANNADMNTSLISSEGFPRSDLDVVEVRTIRVKIIKLKNDLKYLLEELSERLTQHFQRTPSIQVQERQQLFVPFAIITEIVVNSPAERSGLQVQDKIIMFGEIDATNHNDLRNIAHLVKNKQNDTIQLVIKREEELINLSLVPTTNWPGQGLLGCRLNQL